MIKIELFVFLIFTISCLGQKTEPSYFSMGDFQINEISIQNLEEKNYFENNFQCTRHKLQKISFLNIELLVPKNDSIYFGEYMGKSELILHEDDSSFGLLESSNYDDEFESLFSVFQHNLLNDILELKIIDFGMLCLNNLNNVYWIKSIHREEEESLNLLTLFFEDWKNKKVFMVIISSKKNLDMAICKFNPIIESLKLANK